MVGVVDLGLCVGEGVNTGSAVGRDDGDENGAFVCFLVGRLEGLDVKATAGYAEGVAEVGDLEVG